MSDVAIVIVSYNTRDELEACLYSLQQSAPQTRHEIIVVDNASTDGSATAVRASWPHVRVVDAGENIGYARANNIGIRETSSELLLLLNSDTVVPEGAIDGLVSRLLAAPDVGAIGPRLINRAGRPELSFGSMIGPVNESIQKAKGLALSRGVPLLEQWVLSSLARPGCPDWVSGACLLVRRADAERVGLLDERFFLYGEDVDFCAALRKQGRRILFAPEIEVMHLRGRSGVSAPVHTRAAYRRSQIAFYGKHQPRWLPVLRFYLRIRGEFPADGI